jgi:endonuclease G
MAILLATYVLLAVGAPGSVLVHAGTSQGQGRAESPHLALGTPVDADASDDDLVLREGYAISYNHARHGTNWVAWRLEAGDMGGEPRAHTFLPSPSLPPAEQVVSHDYDASGFDRGHLVPAGDRSATAEGMRGTFLLDNALPQRPALNRGPWEGMEKYTRRLAKTHRLFITTGPLWGDRASTIGRHAVPVPTAFWKVVVVLPAGAGPEAVDQSTRVLAAIMPNEEHVSGRWMTYATTLGEVEARSGYRLLGRVPEAVRVRLETKGEGGER